MPGSFSLDSPKVNKSQFNNVKSCWRAKSTPAIAAIVQFRMTAAIIQESYNFNEHVGTGYEAAW
jgi:hypothetical protein